MLLLTRRVGERILIGENQEIVVEFVGIKGGQVRVGITANKKTPILREEVFLRDLVSME